MPTLVALVEETMRRLRAEGTTIVLVQQNLATALSVGDRVYVMEKGKIRAAAAPAELPLRLCSSATSGWSGDPAPERLTDGRSMA